MRSPHAKRARGAIAAIALALGLLTLPAQTAYADNPNVPSAEEIEAFSEDGTLDERVEFMESLDDGAAPLLPMAQDEGSAPFTWASSLPKKGDARILAFRVDFPAGDGQEATTFGEGDTLEALDAIVGGAGGAAPYESVAAYYARSSYGQLSVTGDAFDYTAQHPRSHYTDSKELFEEVLRQLDDTIDYAGYDGNHDGVIDCVAIHFAGPNDGWGSTWWSYAKDLEIVGDDGLPLTFDGMATGSSIMLHRPSNTGSAARTFIHECGHTLGLPDYYQSPVSGDGTGGSQTFDIMDNNLGDHNGFSKWMLGWLDESTQVTWVTVTEDGVTATRGDTSVGTLTGDGGLSLDLSPFTGDDPAQTGGIIVVADHAFEKQSSYYVLQYDTAAGNQGVLWDVDDPKPLSSGFRVFRIQAQANPDGELIHSNIDGHLHDQLLELVDPDGGSSHGSDLDRSVVPSVGGGERWGCMFYAGDALTPSTTPSTSFFESAPAGWSGIAMEFVRSDADGGTVVFRFDASERPSGDDIELQAAEGSLLVPGSTITVYANQDVALEPGALPVIRLEDGTEVACESAQASGPAITVTTRVDADVLARSKTAQVVFPEGSFVLVGGATSPERGATVPVGGVPLCTSGEVSGGMYAPSEVSLSTVLEDEDGALFFYQCDSSTPFAAARTYFKNVIDPEDPAKVTRVELSGDEAEAARQYFYDQSFMSEKSRASEVAHLIPEGADLGDHDWVLDAAEHDGKVYVVSQTWTDSDKWLSVFEADGTLVSSAELGASEHTFARVAFSADGVISVTMYPPFFNAKQHEVTRFLDGDLADLGTLTTNGTGCVRWLPDGRFMTYGRRYSPKMAEGSSITDPQLAICYDIVCRLVDDPEPEPEPTPTPEPEPTPTPEPDPTPAPTPTPDARPASNGKTALPSTGDASPHAMPWALCGLVAVASGALVRREHR